MRARVSKLFFFSKTLIALLLYFIFSLFLSQLQLQVLPSLFWYTCSVALNYLLSAFLSSWSKNLTLEIELSLLRTIDIWKMSEDPSSSNNGQYRDSCIFCKLAHKKEPGTRWKILINLKSKHQRCSNCSCFIYWH